MSSHGAGGAVRTIGTIDSSGGASAITR